MHRPPQHPAPAPQNDRPKPASFRFTDWAMI